MSQISPASYLASLPQEEQAQWLSSLTDQEKAELAYNWKFWARPDQLPPSGDWFTWLILAGRGWGKTRTGSEWVRDLAHQYPGCRIALVAETAADARDVMIKGDRKSVGEGTRVTVRLDPGCRRIIKKKK